MTTQTEALKALIHEMEYVLSCINEDKIPFDGDDFHEALRLGKEALEQPEQEPVTWRNAAIRVGEDLCSVGPFGYYDMTAEQWLDWALSVVTVHAPAPQRTWVGLTEKEILECRSANHLYFYKAIEAKLKEKNT